MHPSCIQGPGVTLELGSSAQALAGTVKPQPWSRKTVKLLSDTLLSSLEERSMGRERVCENRRDPSSPPLTHGL